MFGEKVKMTGQEKKIPVGGKSVEIRRSVEVKKNLPSKKQKNKNKRLVFSSFKK